MRLPTFVGGITAAFAAACWGFPVDQSTECAAYVRCIEAIDRAASAASGTPQVTDLDRYQDGGACWGNPELGKGCTTSCRRALDRLRAREPALPVECAP
ncbi:MAG: hypothetical protein IPH44_39055 [Myxococcales bacterium]|nr:hypothetical protein [Myxococcales bacterium]MBK7198958.1 hypothetical protein [Myxococcales bacterium]MBP6847614.1 hypothetical protein [Kofleriaceae bacterium]